jgi:hypothetical protein
MPKNPVTEPITYQEITFARLVLSGTMTDRQAAEAAGLDPDSAAFCALCCNRMQERASPQC